MKYPVNAAASGKSPSTITVEIVMTSTRRARAARRCRLCLWSLVQTKHWIWRTACAGR